MKRMKLFLHLAHLNHMFLKSVTKTGRDPPSECKKTKIFCEGFPYILRFWRCLQEIQVFSCHTTNEVWMHLLARDEGVLGPGDSWCRGWPLSELSFSPLHPLLQWPLASIRQIIEPEMLAAQLCIGFDMGWAGEQCGSCWQISRRCSCEGSSRLGVSVRLGWGCQLGHMCHVPSLMIRKNFLTAHDHY